LGQLATPTVARKAPGLQPGDAVQVTIERERLKLVVLAGSR